MSGEERIGGVNFDWHNPHSASRLARAVRSKNAAEVKRLIKGGACLDAPDNRGRTPLHEAALSDDLAPIAEILLAAGAYIEHKTFEGETPLFIACSSSCEKVVRALLSHRCTVSSGNIDGVTPLHVACSKKNITIVEMLVRAGAKLNAKDNERLTPLYYAIQFLNPPAVKLLIQNKCNLRTKDYLNRTPLQYSCMIGNLEIFDLLIDSLGVDSVNEQTSDGWTLLMEAVQFKQFALAQKLIQLGADTSLVDSRDLLALHLAAHCDDFRCFSLLLAHTKPEMIEKYGTEKGNLTHARSLPCLLIDKDMYDGLFLLFETKVSAAVLTCPVRMGDSLLSPLSFLFLHTAIPHDKKTQYVHLLLKGDALKDPIYESDLPTIRPVEALIRYHKSSVVSDCELHLRLLLESGLTPDSPAPGPPPAFLLCLESGFVKGLALLLAHTNSVTPERLLSYYLTPVLSPAHSHTGVEELVIRFLSALTCDFSLIYAVLVSALRNSELDPRPRSWCQLMMADASNVRPLKSLTRHFIRKEIMGKGLPLRQTLSSFNLPKPLLRYLMYSDL